MEGRFFVAFGNTEAFYRNMVEGHGPYRAEGEGGEGEGDGGECEGYGGEGMEGERKSNQKKLFLLRKRELPAPATLGTRA